MSVRPQASDAQLGESCLLDEAAMARTLLRLAHEVLERHPSLDGVLLAGVRTRGLPLAMRVARALRELSGVAVPVAELDIAAYRDDRPRPAVPRGDALQLVDGGGVPAVDGAAVIVVDDVFYTGRTLRAALDAVAAVGRAASVDLLVLVDRGHRELPMRATFVGKNVPTSPEQRVAVRVREVDGRDGAFLVDGAR